MLNRQRAYLLDILRAAETIEEYLSGYDRGHFLKTQGLRMPSFANCSSWEKRHRD